MLPYIFNEIYEINISKFWVFAKKLFDWNMPGDVLKLHSLQWSSQIIIFIIMVWDFKSGVQTIFDSNHRGIWKNDD